MCDGDKCKNRECKCKNSSKEIKKEKPNPENNIEKESNEKIEEHINIGNASDRKIYPGLFDTWL